MHSSFGNIFVNCALSSVNGLTILGSQGAYDLVWGLGGDAVGENRLLRPLLSPKIFGGDLVVL